MQREYNFISKLDTDDVAYIMQRKKVTAAVCIQRAFRKKKEERIQRLKE
jgi:hypothetical protein